MIRLTHFIRLTPNEIVQLEYLTGLRPTDLRTVTDLHRYMLCVVHRRQCLDDSPRCGVSEHLMWVGKVIDDVCGTREDGEVKWYSTRET